MAKSVYERLGKSTLAGSDQTARRHIYRVGETFAMIASYEYGDVGYDSELWRQVAEYNGIDDLDNVASGTVLILPQYTPVT